MASASNKRPQLLGSRRPDEPPQGSDVCLVARLVCALAAAPTMQAALARLFDCLVSEYGALALSFHSAPASGSPVVQFGDASWLRPARARRLGIIRNTIPVTGGEAPAKLCVGFPAGAAVPADLLEACAAQLAARLSQEALTLRAQDAEAKAQRGFSEVATIYEIGQAIDRIELHDLLQLITDRAALLMDAQACSLMLVDAETGSLRVKVSRGLPYAALDHEQAIEEGLAGRVARTGDPLLIAGVAADPRLAGVMLRPDISSSMLVPMKNQHGEVLGVLSIRRSTPAADFTQDDLRLFSVFAQQAALAMTNVGLYADLKKRAAELVKVSTLSRVLISTLDLRDLLERVADDIRNTVGFTRCCLFVRDARRATFVPRVWRGYSDVLLRNPIREGEGAVGAVARSRETVVFDARGPAPDNPDRAHLQFRGFARSLGVDSLLVAPILTSLQECISVLIADNKGRRHPITAEQVSLVTAFVSQAGIAIENARLYEEMQDNYQNLHRLTAYTDSVLMSIAAGIVSTDARGRIARWNRAAEQTLCQPAAFFRSGTLPDLVSRLCLPDDERDEVLGMIQRVQGGEDRSERRKLTLHPAGREATTLNLIVSRLSDRDRDRAGVVMIIEDVTQEVRLEGELERMRRLADIGQLAAKMAHEMRNALAPIKGAAQIIRSEMHAQNAPTEWPDIIVSEVDGLSLLTSQMLDFARPATLNTRSTLVNKWLQTALVTLAPFLTEHQVDVHWQLADNLPAITADPDQLAHVVRNVVLNAAESMPDGGTLTITTELRPDATMVAIRFRDTGEGIPGDDIDRIFAPFVTTRPRGTGLGLPIVHKIVAQHGGRVDVESEPGKGACFNVYLPLKPPSSHVEREPVPAPIVGPASIGDFPDN